MAEKNSLIVTANTALTGQTRAVSPSRLEQLRASKAAREEEAKAPKRIAIIIDATASRQPTWDRAQSLMVQMVENLQRQGKFEIGLYDHRGGHSEGLGWFTDGRSASQAMLDIRCQSGGTDITSCFNDVSRLSEKPNAIILVGDCVDGIHDKESVVATAQRLGIKVFSFHEDTNGYDRNELQKGERYYRQIAEVTGGAFAKLGDDMPLDELVEAVGTAVLGPEALKKALLGSNRAVAALVKSNPDLMIEDQRLSQPPAPKR